MTAGEGCSVAISGGASVTVVVPTRNRWKELSELVQSIQRSTYLPAEIVVVDDNSTPSYPPTLATITGFARIIRNSQRLGLAACRDIGYRVSTGSLVLFIDDDNIIGPDTIDLLVRSFITRPEYGVLGPATCYQTDPTMYLFKAVKRSMITGRTILVASGERVEATSEAGIVESDDVPNAFMVPRPVLQAVHGFDSANFPMDYTEAEFCKRVVNAGYRIGIVPRARVYHRSPPISSTTYISSRLNSDPYRAYSAARGKIMYHCMFGRPLDAAIFTELFLPVFATGYIFIILGSSHSSELKARALRAYLAGLMDGLTHLLDGHRERKQVSSIASEPSTLGSIAPRDRR